MLTQLSYTKLSLRRDNMSRRPIEWLSAQMEQGMGVLPVAGNKSLIRLGSPPTAVVFEGADAERIMEIGTQSVFLGTDDRRAVFTVEIPEDLSHEVSAASGPDTEFADIRTYGPLLPDTDGHLLAHARGMIYWHARHGFCGVCGSRTVSKHNGHERVCTNPDCGVSHFPRTDPAVIMLIARNDIPGGACLLGSHARWPFGMYSTLAGFVEPGETLEQCVAREVFEESGIEITDVRYMASQPWPFPSSLMLGFRAIATSFDIDFDPDELKDCQWFTREQVLGMKEWLDAEEGDIRLPRQDSISRWLIQSWLDEG